MNKKVASLIPVPAVFPCEVCMFSILQFGPAMTMICPGNLAPPLPSDSWDWLQHHCEC